MGLAHYGHA